MTEAGYIYFLTNPCMPGLLKIGFTKGELDVRVKQLRSSGVPHAFVLAAAFLVVDPENCEKEIHKLLDSARIKRDREFFKVPASEAILKSFDIIKNKLLNQNYAEVEQPPAPASQYDDADALVLKMLAHDFQDGAPVEEMIRGGHWEHPLNLRNRMIKLSEKGLVEEVRRGNRPQKWRLTNDGLKFMFQHELLIKEYVVDQE